MGQLTSDLSLSGPARKGRRRVDVDQRHRLPAPAQDRLRPLGRGRQQRVVLRAGAALPDQARTRRRLRLRARSTAATDRCRSAATWAWSIRSRPRSTRRAPSSGSPTNRTRTARAARLRPDAPKRDGRPSLQHRDHLPQRDPRSREPDDPGEHGGAAGRVRRHHGHRRRGRRRRRDRGQGDRAVRRRAADAAAAAAVGRSAPRRSSTSTGSAWSATGRASART